jgi:hypothetical protein
VGRQSFLVEYSRSLTRRYARNPKMIPVHIVRHCLMNSGAAIVGVALLVCGCSGGGPSSNIAPSAFAAAPAEVKQLWSDGLSAWKRRRYQDAATSLMSLLAKADSLSTEQMAQLNQARDEFGVEAFAAANKGDAGAVEAVKTLRAGSRRASGGSR